MRPHAEFATLVAYWLGELDEAQEATLEEHYLGCEECSARLAEVEVLATGVRRAVGRIDAVITPTFAGVLLSRGLRVREYHVPRNGSVNCTAAPDDQVLMGRLEVALEGVGRVDALIVDPGKAGARLELRLEDLPFDPASGEVVLVPSVERIRAMPAHQEMVRLVAVDSAGEQVLGEYTFNHTPYA